jgi:hypothetical protein
LPQKNCTDFKEKTAKNTLSLKDRYDAGPSILKTPEEIATVPLFSFFPE